MLQDMKADTLSHDAIVEAVTCKLMHMHFQISFCCPAFNDLGLLQHQLECAALMTHIRGSAYILSESRLVFAAPDSGHSTYWLLSASYEYHLLSLLEKYPPDAAS